MEDILGRTGGEAFNCPHIHDHPDGCGHGPKCNECDLRNVVVTTLATGKPVKRLELTMRLLDDTVHNLMVTTNIAKLQGKDVILLAVEDITALKKQEGLKMKQLQLTTALETVGGMSHELSQPLMVILGFTDLLKELLEDSEHLSHIEMIHKCSLRLKDTVHGLQRMTDYKNKGYVNGKIIDITGSAEKEKSV